MRRILRRGLRRGLLGLAAASAVGFFPGWPESTAEAQYGTSRRVARRTSRRTSYRHNAMYDAAVYPTAATAAVVTSLPAGCVTAQQGGVAYQRCGTAMYRPYYQGDELVYEVVP